MTSFQECRAVEVEVNTHCNLRCPYCPNAKDDFPRRREIMTDIVFLRLVSELSRLCFQGIIAFHFLSEPLLRRDLHRLVKLVRQKLPAATPVLYTNGTLLTDARYDELKQAGISHFIVTNHQGRNIPARPHQTLFRPEDLEITNRGGELSPSECLSVPCFVPTEMIFVSVEGNVFLCYEDARQSTVLGSIMTSPIDEIWQSARFEDLRSALRAGRRQDGPQHCRACNNVYHPKPGTEWGSMVVDLS
jgi:radical SAM protein with 4Fe4S-binding SPASM domain